MPKLPENENKPDLQQIEHRSLRNLSMLTRWRRCTPSSGWVRKPRKLHPKITGMLIQVTLEPDSSKPRRCPTLMRIKTLWTATWTASNSSPRHSVGIHPLGRCDFPRYCVAEPSTSIPWWPRTMSMTTRSWSPHFWRDTSLLLMASAWGSEPPGQHQVKVHPSSLHGSATTFSAG